VNGKRKNWNWSKGQGIKGYGTRNLGVNGSGEKWKKQLWDRRQWIIEKGNVHWEWRHRGAKGQEVEVQNNWEEMEKRKGSMCKGTSGIEMNKGQNTKCKGNGFLQWSIRGEKIQGTKVQSGKEKKVKGVATSSLFEI
jgi:hypothetical protein